jgi:type I restriction enzyme S subunit
MQRYDSYKPSGAEWLGEIPSHWSVTPAKRLFREVSEKNKPDAELLSVTQDFGVVPKSQLEQRVVMPTGQLQTFKLVRKDDFVISLRSFQGGIEYSEFTGLVSPAYTVLRKQKEANSRYLKHLLKSAAFISELNTSVTGIREGKNISFSEMSYSLLPLPPNDEQDRIVTFLDQKTAEIDAAIAKKERLILLLNEQKSILINKAVTKGLNPEVPMRDSGIPWVGYVPSHWNMLRFKYCASITSGQVNPKREPYASMPLIAPNHIEPCTGRLLQIEIARDQGADSGKYLLEAGDLIYSKIRPALRKACISPVAGLCSADMYVLRPNRLMNKRYLLGYLLTDAFTQPALDAALRVAMPKVNREALGDFPMLVPPLEEQEAIADFMSTCEERYNPVIETEKSQLEKLSELRALIVASAVMGKMRV